MNTGFLGPAVATVLTVYGIETRTFVHTFVIVKVVATVLTVYGIETNSGLITSASLKYQSVATVLTVYGIETFMHLFIKIKFFHELQQYLPFTVLKRHLI